MIDEHLLCTLRYSMNTRWISLGFSLLFSIALSAPASAQHVTSISFPTKHAGPAYQPRGKEIAFAPLLQAGLKMLPEDKLIISALTFSPVALGIEPELVIPLSATLSNAYQQIAMDPDMAGIESALPYCFSDRRPESGHAFVYLPKAKPSKQPTNQPTKQPTSQRHTRDPIPPWLRRKFSLVCAPDEIHLPRSGDRRSIC